MAANAEEDTVIADCKFTLFNSEDGAYAGCITHHGDSRFLDTEECWTAARTTRPDEVAAELTKLKARRDAADRQDAERHAIGYWRDTHRVGAWQRLTQTGQRNWFTGLKRFVEAWDMRHGDAVAARSLSASLVLKAREISALEPDSEAGQTLAALADLVASLEETSSFEWGCTWDSKKDPLQMSVSDAREFAKRPGVRLHCRRNGEWFEVEV